MFNPDVFLTKNGLRHVTYRLTHPVWMGNLRRKAPVTRYGWERGTPIDRHYIASFLNSNRKDVRGRVIEILNRCYTEQFGSGVEGSDILDIDRANLSATVFADLTAADAIPSESYDCFILTQTLQYIFDLQAAVRHSHRILKRGGVLLVTVPAAGRNDRHLGDYWRFTAQVCARLFGDVFGPDNITVEEFGNCVSAIGFLGGLAAEDMRRSELARVDPHYPLVICIRAQKE